MLNRFKDTTIYGQFQNSDRLTSATNSTIVEQANAIIDRDLLVSGTLTTPTIKTTNLNFTSPAGGSYLNIGMNSNHTSVEPLLNVINIGGGGELDAVYINGTRFTPNGIQNQLGW